MMAANVYASATDGGTSDAQVLSGAATIDCPDVATQLTEVPDQARAEVDKELANLDAQIAEAYKRLGESGDAIRQDPGFAENAIAGPLKDKRAAVLARIGAAIEKAGAERPQGLDDLAACAVRDSGNAPAPEEGGDGGEQAGDGQDQQNGDGQQDGGEHQGGDQQDGQDQDQGGQDGGQEQGGNGGQAGNGPVAGDYVSIESVQPNVDKPQASGDASTGTFTSECGVNANGVFNSDNVIAAPGVSNGAHHFHDYIGNQATNAFVSDDELTRAETSCEDQRDKSSYYWPVLRLQNGTEEQDAQSPGGGIEGNAGEIVTPKDVTLTFVGNPKAKVTAMPRLLRIITGDAKSFVNGPANANASWSCTGFEDRQLKDKYPLCPEDSDVVRSFAFQSCWDGRNIDSANHRTHMAFTDAEGNCPAGFQPIPQLVQRIVYDVDAPSLEDGGKTVPLFAVDSFPEQLHKPITDHGDFINVFEEDLMNEMVDCINEGRTCGAGAGGGDNGGGDNGGDNGNGGGDDGNGDDGNGNGNGGGDNGAEQPTATPDEPGQGDDGGQDDDNQGGGQNDGDQGGDQGNQGGGQKPPAATEEPADNGDKATAQPDVKVSEPADAGGQDDAQGGADNGDGGNDGGGQEAQAAQVPGSLPELEDDTQAQGAGGSLAETGAQLWPAAIGGVLVIFGFFVLRSVRRNA
ncbi:DUF1996 domain-containing protein [Streptomyces cellulosae]